MQKIKFQFLEKQNNHFKKIEKKVKIDDSLFDIALRKGLIEKEGNDYVFIGEYEELLAFKSKKNKKNFDKLV